MADVNDRDDYIPKTRLSLHQRLGEVCSGFHMLQEEFLDQPGPEQGEKLKIIATGLAELCEERIEQVLGELFLAEHSSYNFSKPLYVAASLVELIRRYNDIADNPIDNGKRRLMVMAALGYNLGLLAYEQQVYASTKEFSPEERRQLREHYPQQSAELLQSAGLGQTLIQDIVRNHNIATDNPSNDAMLLRTPFIYAGIALPQYIKRMQRSIDNPSREFARMYANRELDPMYGGLYLKINGLAPIGSIINFESHEKGVVVQGPGEQDIASSTVRMLTNHNGVQLKRPGDYFQLNQTASSPRGLADHHNFAWTRFSPHALWEE